jgi:hypothetical protein
MRGVEVAVESGEHEDDVDVRRDDLALVALAGCAAHELRAPRQHLLDRRWRTGFDEHEIADRGPLRRIDAALEEARRRLRVEQRLAVVQLIAGAMLRDDARERGRWRRILRKTRIFGPADGTPSFHFRFGRRSHDLF